MVIEFLIALACTIGFMVVFDALPGWAQLLVGLFIGYVIVRLIG